MQPIERLFRIVGSLGILGGLVANPWTVAYVASPDHTIESGGIVVLIAVVDLMAIVIGFLLWRFPAQSLAAIRARWKEALLLMMVYASGELLIAAFGIFAPRPSEERIRYFRDFLAPHETLGYVMRPNLRNFELSWLEDDVSAVYDTDAYGFRNPGVAYTSTSLFFIGDSFGMASWVPREASFFARVGDTLQTPAVSLAVGGYGLPQYEVLAEQFVPHTPLKKTVILLLFANDFEAPVPTTTLRGWYEREMLPDIARPAFAKRLSWKYTATAQAVRALFRGRESATLPNGIVLFTNRSAAQEFKEKNAEVFATSLGRTLELLLRRPDIVRVGLVLLPSKELVYTQEYAQAFGDAAYLENEQFGHVLVMQVAKRYSVPVLDLTETFQMRKDPPLYFNKDPHWNALGHALAADAIIDWLKTMAYDTRT